MDRTARGPLTARLSPAIADTGSALPGKRCGQGDRIVKAPDRWQDAILYRAEVCWALLGAIAGIGLLPEQESKSRQRAFPHCEITPTSQLPVHSIVGQFPTLATFRPSELTSGFPTIHPEHPSSRQLYAASRIDLPERAIRGASISARPRIVHVTAKSLWTASSASQIRFGYSKACSTG